MLGLGPSETPVDVTAATRLSIGTGPNETAGSIRTGQGIHPYLLRWRVERGAPVVGGLAPGAMPDDVPICLVAGVPSEIARRLGGDGLVPAVELAEAGALLWDVRSQIGLPLVGRALALLSFVEQDAADLTAALTPGEVAGVALDAVTHPRVRRSLAGLGVLGELSIAAVTPAALRALRRRLERAPTLGW